MSIHALSWVLRESEEKLGRRLTLIVLADHAHDDGTEAWPSVETIAREGRLSKRQVQACLRDLEASGAIEQTDVRPNGTRIYRIVMDAPRGGAGSAPQGGAESAPGGCGIVHEGGAETAPKPSKSKPSLEPRTPLGPPAQVDRKPVTSEEARISLDVLAEWNLQTGQNLVSPDWLAKFVMRIRERPDLTVVDHAHVIAAALADPWWRGPPTPSVVYGSGAQFERSILAATSGPRIEKPPNRRYGYGVGAAEMLERARKLEEEGR